MHKPHKRVLFLAIAAIFVAVAIGFNIAQLLTIKDYQTAALSQSATPVATPVAPKAIDTISVNNHELQCLAESIYFESGSQSLVGKYAVGHVVLNRVAKSNYPNTVCGVINQRIGNTCMFSWKCTEPKHIPSTSPAWKQSYQVALKLLSYKRKDLVDITDGATHFHAAGIDPKWKLKRITKIDDHLFYK